MPLRLVLGYSTHFSWLQPRHSLFPLATVPLLLLRESPLPPQVSLGRVAVGSEHDVDLRIFNPSAEPVALRSIRTSCGSQPFTFRISGVAESSALPFWIPSESSADIRSSIRIPSSGVRNLDMRFELASIHGHTRAFLRKVSYEAVDGSFIQPDPIYLGEVGPLQETPSAFVLVARGYPRPASLVVHDSGGEAVTALALTQLQSDESALE